MNEQRQRIIPAQIALDANNKINTLVDLINDLYSENLRLNSEIEKLKIKPEKLISEIKNEGTSDEIKKPKLIKKTK